MTTGGESEMDDERSEDYYAAHQAQEYVSETKKLVEQVNHELGNLMVDLPSGRFETMASQCEDALDNLRHAGDALGVVIAAHKEARDEG